MKGVLAFVCMVLFVVTSTASTCDCICVDRQGELDSLFLSGVVCDTVEYINIGYSAVDPIINLDALSGVEAVMDGIFSSSSQTITDYSGLDNIEYIGRDLWYDEFVGDHHYARFRALRKVFGDVEIALDNVDSLDIFGLLEEIEGHLVIQYNDQLVYLGPIGSSWSAHNVEVQSNEELASLDFLVGCRSVQRLIINANYSLTDVSDIDATLEAGTVGYCEIENNWNLDFCGYDVLCNLSQVGSLVVSNNGLWCSTNDRLQDFCNYDTLLVYVPRDDCYLIDQVSGPHDVHEIINAGEGFYSLCDLHPRGSQLGDLEFELYIDNHQPQGSAPYCQRVITVHPDVQPVGDVLVRLYYSDTELQTLVDADPEIESVHDLRVSVFDTNCRGPREIVAEVHTPHLIGVTVTTDIWYFDISPSILGTFYLHGPQDLLLDNDEAPVEQVKIYPNPVTDVLTVSAAKGMTYKILDLSGRIVGSGVVSADGSIDMGNLAAGIYMMVLDDDQRRHRIVKL